MATVKCPACGIAFDRDKQPCVHLGNRYYHLDCCTEDEVYRDKIFTYLKELWGDYTYTKINNQINSYWAKNKYRPKQIYYDLKYFFEVEKGDPKAYPNTIGIVPFIHDRAQEHYANLEKKAVKKQIISEQLIKESQKAEETIPVQVVKQTRKKMTFEIEEG